MIIDGYTLVQTCKESPEQYTVYKDGEQVAYIRLRHGCLRVDAPICGAKEIFYTESCRGDGRFEDDERMIFYNKRLMRLKNIITRCKMVTFILLNLAGLLVARALIVGNK